MFYVIGPDGVYFSVEEGFVVWVDEQNDESFNDKMGNEDTLGALEDATLVGRLSDSRPPEKWTQSPFHSAKEV